jgi:hypothetical protein
MPITPNDVSAFNYKILARAVLHLRSSLWMPRLVNSDFADEAKAPGSTVDVKIPTALTAYDIVPSVVRTETNGRTMLTVPISLNKWKGAGFYLTDKEALEINAKKDYLPMQTTEAVKAIARVVNADLLSHYKKVSQYVGTAGQTPFQEYAPPATQDYQGLRILAAARKALDIAEVPPEDRYAVWDPGAAANARSLPAFTNVNQAGTDATLRKGDLGTVNGFNNVQELQVLTHTAGTLTGTVTVTGVNAVGAKTLSITTASGAAVALKAGDVVTFAGSTKTHAVLEDLTVGASSTGILKLNTGIAVATVGGEAVAVKASHVANLAGHRYGIAFVNRPLDSGIMNNPNISVLQDPVSGLTLRLELKRENKQDYWEFDMLWGSEAVVPDLLCRVAG